jgi:hypothetical protein
MCVELYGFGTEPPPDETAETETVIAWRNARKVLAGSKVPLHYMNINDDLETAFWLRVWNFPTFRVLLGNREIGRSNLMFLTPDKLERWLREVIARA